MEKFYFIPTSSLNFNNILSSESISPPSFYEKRGYGFKRFEKVLSNSFTNSLLAYSLVPRVPLLNSEKEEYIIYVALPSSYLRNYKSFEKDQFQILQIDRPLYINPVECFFLVRSEEERRKLIAGSSKSLEVKHSNLYSEKIFLLDEYHLDSVPWNDKILDEIGDLKNINHEALEKDQRLNKLKGLIYGYVAGSSMNQPSEFIEGKRYFQRYINVFSGLMNDLSVMSSGKTKVFPNHKKLENQISELIDLQQRIAILFGGNETLELNQAIGKDFGVDNETIKILERAKYKNTRESILSIISKFLKEKEPSYYSIDELLGKLTSQANQLIRFGNSQSYARLETDFVKISDLIGSKISAYKSDNGSSDISKELPFKIDEDFHLNVKDLTLSKEERLIFELILNEFLSWVEVSTSDEIAQIRLDFVLGVGKKIKEVFEKESTPEIEYLRGLYQSLKTIGVGFRVDGSENIALQSIACFLNRYSELEKLQDFMEKNGVRKFNYAYTYWGAAYGYANLSKLLISSTSRNPELLSLINSFFENLVGVMPNRNSLVIDFLSKFKGEKPIVVDLDVATPKKLETPKILSAPSKDRLVEQRSFEQLLRSHKTLGKNEDWIIHLVNFSNQAIKGYEEPGLFSSPKNIHDKFRKLIEKNMKKLKGFGPAKVEEATSLFESFYKHE